MFSVTAAPDTNLITLDGEDVAMPVVGWVCGPSGAIVPMIFGRSARMVTGEAIEFPSGLVVDPTTRAAYESAEVWRAFIEDTEPYSVGSQIGFDFVPVFDTPAEPKPVTKAPALDGASFTGKTFAKTSFWRVGNRILTLTPDNKSPVGSGVLKITREAYVELRKTLPESTMESLMSNDEPELPLGGDDDDADDLI